MINYDYYNLCKVQEHLAGNPPLEVIKKWMAKNEDKMELDDMGNIWGFKGKSVCLSGMMNDDLRRVQWDNVITISKRNAFGGFDEIISIA